jgi:glucose/arabinose dehydrogenase
VAVCALAGAAACQPTTPSTSSGALPRAHDFSTASIKLTPINNLPGAITMATRTTTPGPVDDPTLYVATQNGQIYAISHDGATRSLVLDLSSLVFQNGGERGLLGMTFSSDGTKLYVHYSAAGSGATVVDEYPVSNSHPFSAITSSIRREVFTFPQPQNNHNGGSLVLGPDGLLYLALGDGGGGNDGAPGYGSGHAVGGNGQSLATPLGKVLRIDPTPSGLLGYTVPPSNPFPSAPGPAALIWSYGLRNPFRISFDRSDPHDLWIGDVGQNAREEIDFVAQHDPKYPGGKGANFGWNLLEGFIDGPNAIPASRSQTVRPVFDIDHNHGDCAIIGGYVYRGTAITSLAGVGAYLYTDNCNGSIRGLMVQPGGKGATNRALGATVSSPASFGEDNAGELYVLSLTNGLLRIDQGP